MLARPSPVGARVRARRVRLKLSQKELAFAAGVPRGWLSLLELGEITSPGAQRLEKLSRALGVSTRYLLTGADEPKALSPVFPDDLEEEARLRWFKALPRLVQDQLRRIGDALADYVIEQRPNRDTESEPEPESEQERTGEQRT